MFMTHSITARVPFAKRYNGMNPKSLCKVCRSWIHTTPATKSAVCFKTISTIILIFFTRTLFKSMIPEETCSTIIELASKALQTRLEQNKHDEEIEQDFDIEKAISVLKWQLSASFTEAKISTC